MMDCTLHMEPTAAAYGELRDKMEAIGLMPSSTGTSPCVEMRHGLPFDRGLS
jgi:hypothetical protein